MRAEQRSANGDAISRAAPGRKRALLPHNNHGHPHNNGQHIAEQQRLLANGAKQADGAKQANGSGGNDKPVSGSGGPSKQRRFQWHLSLREWLVLAFGFVSALTLLWSAGMLRRQSAHREGTEPEIPLELLPDHPIQPNPATMIDDSRSDTALLQPILGKSYKDLLSLRKSRFADVRANDPDRCRHPAYYDVDYTYHNLTLGSYAQIWTDERVKSHFKWKKKRSKTENKKSLAKQKAKYLTPSGWDATKQRWTAADVIVGENSTWTFVNSTDKSSKPSKDALQALKSKPKPRSITFLHVGKAGGSSVSCNIRAAFKWGKRHCPGYEHGNKLRYAYGSRNDSAISKQVHCYVHYNERLYCYDNPSFVVNVRNPIDRLISWYLYEHRENWAVTANHTYPPNRPKHCGQQMLFSCYPTLDSLAAVGLAGDRPSDGDMLRIRHDLTEDECRRWAWAAVRGRIPASYHNVWNYEWYLSYLLDRKARGKDLEIFVLRIEHLDEDWSNLDKLLGGTGAALPKSRSHNNDASKKQLAVSDKTMSADGMANLCRALCREIQVYRQVLEMADNLERDQVAESLRELKKICPKTNERGCS